MGSAIYGSRQPHQILGPQFQRFNPCRYWVQIVAHVSSWHIASFRCDADFGRYRGIADIDQAAPINLDL
jgi:hypothetical protein